MRLKFRLTSACLQARNNIVNPILYRIGPERTGGTQVQLNMMSAARGVGVSGHGLSLAHVRVESVFAQSKIQGCSGLCPLFSVGVGWVELVPGLRVLGRAAVNLFGGQRKTKMCGQLDLARV